MNGISLFAGVAGLDLGISQIFPQSHTIAFIERDIYSASVLRSHIEAGTLPMATIYSDVTTFSSHAHHFTNKVDFITAGFPCQPFSKAGQRKSTKDHRWLWSSILDIINQVRPSFLFLENVSNLLNEHEAFSEILSTLAQIGFNVEWLNLQAAEVGANHQRNRVFLFAYQPQHLHLLPYSDNLRHNRWCSKTNPKPTNGPKVEGPNPSTSPLPYTHSERRREGFNSLRSWQSNPQRSSHPISSNSNNQRCSKPNLSQIPKEKKFPGRQDHGAKRPEWWQTNPPPFSPICRVDDGISHGMDRLRALGNAVVPYQANVAYTYLINQAKTNQHLTSISYQPQRSEGGIR